MVSDSSSSDAGVNVNKKGTADGGSSIFFQLLIDLNREWLQYMMYHEMMLELGVAFSQHSDL